MPIKSNTLKEKQVRKSNKIKRKENLKPTLGSAETDGTQVMMDERTWKDKIRTRLNWIGLVTRPKTEVMCTHCLGGYKGAPLYLTRQCGLIAFVFSPVLA